MLRRKTDWQPQHAVRRETVSEVSLAGEPTPILSKLEQRWTGRELFVPMGKDDKNRDSDDEVVVVVVVQWSELVLLLRSRLTTPVSRQQPMSCTTIQAVEAIENTRVGRRRHSCRTPALPVENPSITVSLDLFDKTVDLEFSTESFSAVVAVVVCWVIYGCSSFDSGGRKGSRRVRGSISLCNGEEVRRNISSLYFDSNEQESEKG